MVGLIRALCAFTACLAFAPVDSFMTTLRPHGVNVKMLLPTDGTPVRRSIRRYGSQEVDPKEFPKNIWEGLKWDVKLQQWVPKSEEELAANAGKTPNRASMRGLNWDTTLKRWVRQSPIETPATPVDIEVKNPPAGVRDMVKASLRLIWAGEAVDAKDTAAIASVVLSANIASLAWALSDTALGELLHKQS